MSVPGRRDSLLGIALKSYRQRHHLRVMLKIYSAMIMKLLNTSLLHCAIVVGALLAAPLEGAATTGPDQSGDPGWPRAKTSNGNRLTVYQPQVDNWKSFKELSWRMAVSLTPKGGKEVVGVVEMKGNTEVDNVNKVVVITNPEITGTYFPSLDPATKEKTEQLFKSFVPPTVSISLHRLIASVPVQQAPPGVQLNNDPPKIFVGYRPSILLSVDGEPVLSEVPNTNLKFVLNTQWPLFFDGNSTYYLAVGQQWLTASSIDAQWSPAKKLPPDMSKVAQDKQWIALKKVIPPPAKSAGVTPAVFYSDKPAEVILFDGQPVYAQVPDTQLTYATNTDSVVFVFTPTQQFYYLTAGRWFSAMDLQGPWTYATPDLPADFAKIPLNSPAPAILASVPGTDEAKDAVLLAQVPTTIAVKPAEAQAKVKVEYGGDPKFEPIKGTSISYATNTQDKVIKVGDVYYLCLQGVWFMSPNPQGPWTTCTSVPQEIYTIPPSSPVYNVTYVTQSTNPDGTVQASYTAGYLGAFVLGAATGAIIASGSGYWWPPYAYGGYYYPYAATYCGGYYYGGYGYHYATPYYNSATGAYGWKQTAYGPYGSVTRGAAYNPYTGTYARGASVSTPYGSRSAAQAYNPYTGTYAQTRQGSSPNAQWGSSYVSRGNQSATMGHYSTANGTVAGISGSQGGKAAGASTAWGNTAAGKTASGNMYAGHDGNVYKNTGNGWQKYDNGSWNSVNKPQPNWQGAESSQQRTGSQSSQQRTSASSSYNRSGESSYNRSGESGYNRSGGGSSSEMQNMQREAQNRQRGGQESQRFQQASRGAGGAGWGGRGGGGGRSRR